jgi:hypothetical protein
VNVKMCSRIAIEPASSRQRCNNDVVKHTAHSMSSSEQDFEAELEQDAEADLAKLADMAQHGVPKRLRGRVWLLLLGASHPDKRE